MTLTLLPLLVACQSTLQTQEARDTDFEEPTDEDAPAITYEAFDEAQPYGTPVAVTASITDGEEGTGVLFVYLRFKPETGGSQDWRDVLMSTTDELTWSGSIPGDAAATSGGVYYYIEAIDGNDNAGTSPSRGEDDPYHYRVYVE